MKRLRSMALVLAMLIPVVASGQTASSGVAGTSPAATSPAGSATGTSAATSTSDTVTVPIWPQAAVKLGDAAQPAQASFSLGQVDGIPSDLVAGVTARGYARQVNVNSEPVGQVLVTSVSKGDKVEQIGTNGLSAQFDATDTSTLFPEKNLDVQGSKAALLDALKRLAATTPTATTTTTTTDTAAPTGSSGTASNPLADSYKAPTATDTPAATTPDTTTSQTTTAGCSVRVDFTQGKAIQQSMVQTTSNGTTTNGPCTDSEVSWPLQKSYAACTDIVDLNAMTAWPQFQWYYTDNGAENHTVSDCTQDTSTPYTITETESQCSISIDTNAGTATPQAALVYTNRSNQVIQVRSCAASTVDKPITMSKVTSGCSIRNDFAGGVSYEQAMWQYVWKGTTYQATPCTDDGTTFPEVKTYQDAGGNNLCTPITDMTNMEITLQYRLQITVGGLTQNISDCTPDTSSHSIITTTDGCMDPSTWTHDLSAGVSYGQQRFYYLGTDGTTREYVTACQTSTVTYPQSQTITGWQNHDDQLYAYPMMTVTITVNGSPYTIVSNQILSGAAQMPYTLSGTVDTPDGNSTYDGCSAYRETTRYDQWQRPDGTIYQQSIGVGTPQGPINICSQTLVGTQYLTTGNVVVTVDNNNLQQSLGVQAYEQTTTTYAANVNKYSYVNTETGQSVTTNCAFQTTWQQFVASSVSQEYSPDASGGGVIQGYPPYFPDGTYTHQTLTVPPCPF